MLSTLRIIFVPVIGGQGLSSSLSSSAQLSLNRMQRLCRTVQAITFFAAKSAVPLVKILHRLLIKPNEHSTFTLATESSLLNLISSRSLVPSGYGFINQGLTGYALSPIRYGPISFPSMLTV